jgi:RNase P subunit RPR2
MEEKDSLTEISKKLIQEMEIWNASNPDATFLEIEVKARELVSKLEARLIQDSALEREKDNWSKREEKERPTCPNCHVPLISRGKRMRHLQGTTGRQIEIERTYGTCPKCGTGFFPLDEKLKLQPGSLTPLQLDHLMHYATLQSFDKAAQMLMQHHGVQVSASTSRRQTESIGASAELVQNEQGKVHLLQKTSDSDKDIEQKKPVKLVVSNDGAHISLRRKVWAEVKTMAVGEVQENRNPSKQRPNQEIKMVNISYFSRMTDSETFTELIIGELERRGFFDADLVAALQDGAEWIQSLVAALRADIIRILDFYHAGQYLSDIAALVRHAGTQLPAKWWEEQLHELKHQGPEKVLGETIQLLEDNPNVADLDKKVKYLQKRKEMMQYQQFRKQGWPIGSGSVESANVGVVQARLKGVGMHWERKNVNPMLALRVGECNDRWEETREQAFRQRLLTRNSQRFARQVARYEEIEQKVAKNIMRLLLLSSPSKLKQTQSSLSSSQADPVPAISSTSETAKTSITAKSHPRRQYPAKK